LRFKIEQDAVAYRLPLDFFRLRIDPGRPLFAIFFLLCYTDKNDEKGSL